MVSGGPTPTVCQRSNATIPIVMAFDNDPVGYGFRCQPSATGREHHWIVDSCPGDKRKTTGAFEGDRSPALARGRPRNSTRPGNAQVLKEMELAAGAYGVKLQYLDVRDPKDIETAFRAASKGRADAVLVLASAVLISQRSTDCRTGHKEPAPGDIRKAEFVEVGGLMTYGVNINDLDRRAATYVDKILKGTKPADLPVEQPKKFEFIINLKAAKQIGLTIPPNVLARADRVIR